MISTSIVIPYLFSMLIQSVLFIRGEELLGSFTNYQHGIGGSVYKLDSKTILIKGFTYDGQGPDAFFVAGSDSNGPSGSGGTLLTYPFKGQHFDYNDKKAPILSGAFTGKQDIRLTLPNDKKVSDFKWISVWCRAYSVNFGDLFFSVNEDSAAEPEGEPESEHDHDHDHNSENDIHHHYDKSYAEAENSAASLSAQLLTCFMAAWLFAMLKVNMFSMK